MRFIQFPNRYKFIAFELNDKFDRLFLHIINK